MGSATIRSLPPREPKPGENPLRTKLIEMLMSAASDPTSIEVGPLGMTKALKGIKGYHGTPPVSKVKDYTPEGVRIMKTPEELKTFQHFERGVGRGAGGDLYGEAIYIAGHPNISAGYAHGVDVKRFPGPGTTGLIRKQNIPPQAKIIDVHTPLTPKQLKEISEKVGDWEVPFVRYPQGGNIPPRNINEVIEKVKSRTGFTGTLDNIIEYGNLSRKHDLPKIVKELGYDGVSYEAGRIMGLPPGVPEGTRNYAIYNYDIINKPRKVAVERGFKKAKESK